MTSPFGTYMFSIIALLLPGIVIINDTTLAEISDSERISRFF